MDGCFAPRRIATAALAGIAWVPVAHAAATTTTTLPACRGLTAECHCADDVACTAIFECADPTVRCAEVRAICLDHCADHGGPGDCGDLQCADACTGRQCR